MIYKIYKLYRIYIIYKICIIYKNAKPREKVDCDECYYVVRPGDMKNERSKQFKNGYERRSIPVICFVD